MHPILQICLYICMALTLCASVGFFFSVFIEFVTILLLFYVLVFWLPDLISPTRDRTYTLCTGTRLPGKSPVTQCVLSWNLRTGYYLLIISLFFFFLRTSLVIQERLHVFLCFSLSLSDLSPVLFSSFYT